MTTPAAGGLQGPPQGGSRGLGPWRGIGLVSLAIIVLAVPLSRLRPPGGPDSGDLGEAPARFVGGAACFDCHKAETEAWRGSDHDLAMAAATAETVLGDFDDARLEHHGMTSRFFTRDGCYYVETEGPGGAMGEFEVTHVFGHDPLQQYLTPFPGGRLQALSLAWDSLAKRWFHLYPDRDIPPDDWLHWTRNGQNWNGMCAECHSTNLKKGYDPDTDTYDTTWTDIDVGCEACHGPGSRHVAWAELPPMARPEIADAGLAVSTADLAAPALVGLCAPCHSRRAELGDYDHTGHELMDHMLPSLLQEGLYHADGQILDEVYVYGSFLQSKMYARDVRCGDCHDSHSLKLRKEGNELCLQCHEGPVYDTEGHHFHKKIHEGRPSDGALCVKCHMPESPYMVIDYRADHSFRVPRPDLSAALGTPNSCTQGGCHDDRPLSWSLDAYVKWYGQARKPHFATAFAAARQGDPAAAPELTRLVESTLQPAIVRATALDLLAGLPGGAGAAVVEAALASDEPLLRHAAVSRLPVADPARRVELLAPLLADPVKAVRLAAVSALVGAPPELLKAYQQEALERGLEEYRATMAHSLDFASSGMNLGNLEAALGRPRQAEAYYRQALAIDDLFFPAKLNLAVLVAGEGRLDEAETLVREILAAYPENADAAYSLALLLVEKGRPDEALEWLQRAVAADPSRPRTRYNMGLLLQQMGRLDEARAALSAALELEPDSLDYLYALADHLIRRGMLEQALPLAERMICLYPGQPIGRDMRAMILRARAGDPVP